MGTFIGHDHYNDYIGVHYDIALVYGRITKILHREDSPLAGGGRVIVLTDGQRSFDTWIRDLNGDKVLECRWSDAFVKN